MAQESTTRVLANAFLFLQRRDNAWLPPQLVLVLVLVLVLESQMKGVKIGRMSGEEI